MSRVRAGKHVPKTTEELRAKFAYESGAGFTHRQIAERHGVNRKTVALHLKRLTHGSPKPVAETRGRPRVLSERDLRAVEGLVKREGLETVTAVHRAITQTLGVKVSRRTVHNRLCDMDYFAYRKRNRPRLTTEHQNKRLAWALAHEKWTEKDFEIFLWSDETKINRISSDGKRTVLCKKGAPLDARRVNDTVKFGGECPTLRQCFLLWEKSGFAPKTIEKPFSFFFLRDKKKHAGGCIMVWSCMTKDGFGEAALIQERMDAKIYVEIMQEHMLLSAEYLFGKRNFVFQQDNDPKHTSKLAKDWFKRNNITVMEWPANSPDMNPIEHAWGRLKQRVREQGEARNIDDLWQRTTAALNEMWAGKDTSFFAELVASMPRRVAALIEAQGGYTKY